MRFVLALVPQFEYLSVTQGTKGKQMWHDAELLFIMRDKFGKIYQRAAPFLNQLILKPKNFLAQQTLVRVLWRLHRVW